MIEYTTKSYRVTVSPEGLLEIWSKHPPVLTEETHHPDGSVEKNYHMPNDAGALGELARALAKMPLLAATVAEDDEGYWHVDVDAGMQRWHGMREESFVLEGLRNIGLSEEQVGEISRVCHEHPWQNVPRQG